jgi:hypothetical protein
VVICKGCGMLVVSPVQRGGDVYHRGCQPSLFEPLPEPNFTLPPLVVTLVSDKLGETTPTDTSAMASVSPESDAVGVRVYIGEDNPMPLRDVARRDDETMSALKQRALDETLGGVLPEPDGDEEIIAAIKRDPGMTNNPTWILPRENLEPPSGPQLTSVDAAKKIRHSTPRLRQIVHGYLLKHPLGATDMQMQRDLKMNPSTQRPRRLELVRLGFVEDSGERRVETRTKAIVWKAVAQ